MKRKDRAAARKDSLIHVAGPERRASSEKGLIRGHVHRAMRDERAPRVVRQIGRPPEPAVCERCGAVYAAKTWRAGDRALKTPLSGVRWTVCPACRQVAEGEYFGRVVIRGAYAEAHEEAIGARVRGVAARAAYTQPERRIVSMERTEDGLEVLTTSQKLAHRIARSLTKGFGGQTEYHWTEPHGQLFAVWERDDLGAERTPRGRAPRGGARTAQPGGFDLEIQTRRIRLDPRWRDLIEEEAARFAERFPRLIRLHITMSHDAGHRLGTKQAALVANVPSRTIRVTKQAEQMLDALRAAFRAAERSYTEKRRIRRSRARTERVLPREAADQA
jgi:ribosome-associated translation inhibitor RaiA